MLYFTIVKIKKSAIYSIQGLVHVFKTELSFRIELYYLLISLIVLWLIPFTLSEKIMIISTIFILLATEILNTAIERIVNQLSPEKSTFAKNAKDLGSAAVFMIITISLIQWAVAIFSWLKK